MQRRSVYVSLCIELAARGISYEREKQFQVRYRDQLVGALRVDLLVERQVVVELKAVEQLLPVHGKQLLNYMRIAGVRAGLLVNFNVALLPDGLNRNVL